MTSATYGRKHPRAFTLIELLVVIGIIAVLVAVVLTVGRRVTAGSRTRLTEDALKVLGAALDEYKATKGGPPPGYVQDPGKTTVTRTAYMPIVDGAAITPASGAISSMGWFLYQVAAPESTDAVTTVDAILKDLNPKFVKSNLSFPTSGTSGPVEAIGKDGKPLRFRTVVDAFGKDIRFVHPTFDGIIDPAEETWKQAGDVDSKQRYYSVLRIRRSVKDKDADGGYCKNGQPYFYSAGPDGDPSTTDENVYLEKPDFRKD